MLKIYDKFMNEMGIADKRFIHQSGLWHKVVAGIIYNKENKSILFQTIYPKDSYTFDRPDYIDFSIGGHVEDDETDLVALKREALEEMGYEVDEYTYLGIRRIVADPAPTYKIREFQNLYALPYKELDYSKMDNEVKSIIEVKISDLIDLIDCTSTYIKATETILDKETREKTSVEEIKLQRNRIIPDYLKDSFLINLLYRIKSL